MSRKTGLYKVTNISPDLQNRRHKSVASEREAIRTLLSNDKKHKIVELAKDIVSEGSLDPSTRLIITEDTKNKGHFFVLEGNRRITALKILTNPNLTQNLPISNEIKKLSEKFKLRPITQVECIELPRKEADIWIKRKHYKAMGGAGTVEWDAIARAKSDAEDGFYAPWLAAAKYLEKNGENIGYIEEGLEYKSTTADRVLGSSFMPKILGITIFKDGKIEIESGGKDKAIEIFHALFRDMVSKDFVETKVSSKEQIEDYLFDFVGLSAKNSPPTKPADNNENEENVNGNSTSSGNNTNNDKKPKAENKKGAKKRDKLAAKGLIISHEHLNKLYSELTRLPVSKYTHSAAGMIRIFLEKATMVYLEEMKVKHPGGLKWDNFDVKLRDKVKTTINSLDPKKTNKKLKPARDIANGVKDGLHCLEILHEYIHNHESLPAPSELITIWDRLHPFYDEMFRAIEAKS